MVHSFSFAMLLQGTGSIIYVVMGGSRSASVEMDVKSNPLAYGSHYCAIIPPLIKGPRLNFEHDFLLLACTLPLQKHIRLDFFVAPKPSRDKARVHGRHVDRVKAIEAYETDLASTILHSSAM